MGCSYPSSTSEYAESCALRSESSSAYTQEMLEAPAAPGTAESRKHPTGASGWLHVWKGLWNATSATRPVESRAQPFSFMSNIAIFMFISMLLVSVSYAACSVTNCKWSSTNTVVAGTSVNLQATFSGCSGKTLSAKIYDFDYVPGGDDLVDTLDWIISGDGGKSKSWTTFWTEDGGATDNPEYGFKIFEGTTQRCSSYGNGELIVTPKPECTSGACCDTSTQKYKSSSTSCSSWPEYRCSGTGASSNVEKRTATQYCTGSSNTCSGTITGSWSVDKDCDSNQKCSGSGTSFSCACVAPCTKGNKQCDGSTGYQECKSDSNGCTYWSSTTSCASRQTCSGGSCSCDNKCSSGEKKCDGNGYQSCQSDSNGCRYWSSTTSCASDEKCVTNTGCVKKCKVSNCRWETPGNVNEGSTAVLKADFSYCEGKSLTTKIFETDWPQSDGAWTEAYNTPWSVSGSGAQSRSWTVTWMDDTDTVIGDINPEYTFRIWNDDGEVQCDSGSCPYYVIGVCPSTQILKVQKTCSNQCSYVGEKKCDGQNAKVCKADNYGCLYLETVKTCGIYEKCEAGDCKSKSCVEAGYPAGPCYDLPTQTECKADGNPYKCTIVSSINPILWCWEKTGTCTSNEVCKDPLSPTVGARCETRPGCQYNNPACDSNHNCVSNECVLKSGCQYNNPACNSDQNCISNQCVLKSGCQYHNPDCGPNDKCENNVCVAQPCKVTNCKWDPVGVAKEGTSVQMKANFEYCSGKTVDIKVYETDWPQSDAAWVEADSISWSISGSGTNSKPWTVKWMDDTGTAIGDINPEYTFRIWADGINQCDSGSEVGSIVKALKNCNNQCTIGQKRCNGQMIEECKVDKYDCLNWTNVETCGTYDKCMDEKCVAKTCADLGYKYDTCNLIDIGIDGPTVCKEGNPYECKATAWGWTGLPTLWCWDKLETCTTNQECTDPLGPAVGAHCECKSDYEMINGQCVLRGGCQYHNPDCGVNYKCENNECKLMPCTVANCRWDPVGVTKEGSTVQMKADFTYCNGKAVDIKVYETDWPQSDAAWVEAGSMSWSISGSGTNSKPWTVKWIDDTGTMPGDINPEYTFTVWVDGTRQCDSGSEVGSVVKALKNCSNQCNADAVGQKTCDGQTVKECKIDQYDCLYLEAVKTCETYEKCALGECVAKTCEELGYYSSCSILSDVFNPTSCQDDGNPYECKASAWGLLGIPTLYCWQKLDMCKSNETCNDPLGPTGAHCELKPGCQYHNPDCESDKNCINNTCVLKCQIQNIYWSATNATEGDEITMTVETGEGCNGKTAVFGIYENDDTSPDDYETNKTAVVSNGKATAAWTARWQKDCILDVCGNPEYYFTANIDGENKTSLDIKVAKKPDPCNVTTAYWSSNKSWIVITSKENDEVTLFTELTPECSGKGITFEIYEDDDTSPNDYEVTKTAAVSSSIATATWTARWQEDCILDVCGDPEYYFIIKVDGKEIGKSTEMGVSKEYAEVINFQNESLFEIRTLESLAVMTPILFGLKKVVEPGQYAKIMLPSGETLVRVNLFEGDLIHPPHNFEVTKSIQGWIASKFNHIVLQGKLFKGLLRAIATENGKIHIPTVISQGALEKAPAILVGGARIVIGAAGILLMIEDEMPLVGGPDGMGYVTVQGANGTEVNASFTCIGDECSIIIPEAGTCYFKAPKGAELQGETIEMSTVEITRCEPSECRVLGARWNMTNAFESDIASMDLSVTPECEGKKVMFSVYEYDPTWIVKDRYVENRTATITGEETKADWRTVRIEDCTLGVCSDPEYYFKVTLDGEDLGPFAGTAVDMYNIIPDLFLLKVAPNPSNCSGTLVCGDWSPCADGSQSQTCTYVNVSESCAVSPVGGTETRSCSIICSNECSTGQKRCSESSGYQVCTQNSSGCWKWISTQYCSSDQECSDGNCVTKSGCQYSNPSCSSDYNCVSNQCIKKSGCQYSNPSCRAGYDCVNNQCQKICVNDCNSGDKRCFGTAGYQTCVLDENGCRKWSGTNSCGSSEECNNGNCECKAYWKCTDWSLCNGGTQTRECTASAACVVMPPKPSTTQTCTVTPMDDVGVRITSFSILNKAEVKRGAAGEIELQFEIKNNMDIIWGSNGPIDMNEVSVNWKAYIEGTDVASTGTELLVGGGTKTITTKLTSQNRIVRIRVLADYTNSIKETNENNNEAVIDIVTG